MLIMKNYWKVFYNGIFIGNHGKIGTTLEGVEGPGRQQGPKVEKGDIGPKKRQRR